MHIVRRNKQENKKDDKYHDIIEQSNITKVQI